MLQARLSVLALLACLAVAGLIAGQDKGAKKAEEETKSPLPRHYEQLGLRQDQERAIRKAQASYRAKVAALRKKIEAIRDKEARDSEKVLTPAQLKLLRDYQTGEGSEGQVTRAHRR